MNLRTIIAGLLWRCGPAVAITCSPFVNGCILFIAGLICVVVEATAAAASACVSATAFVFFACAFAEVNRSVCVLLATACA